jgi:peptidoglycan/xylan/chitin deacetylase (PgdA/CDA1 family)
MYAVVKLKRILLCALAAAATFAAVGGVYLKGVAKEDVSLPIFMYHSVLKDTSKSGKYVITPNRLERDIEYLEKLGFTSVSAQNVIDFVKHGAPLPEKPYLLTFDDGSYNNMEYVLPILQKHNAYAVFSIVGSYSDRFSKTGEASVAYGYLRWQDIKKLSESGRVEIANHSFNMHSIKNGRIGSARASGEERFEYIGKFTADCDKAQRLLKENCGLVPRIYTYPFGAYCDDSREALKKDGFVMTLTCTEGINTLTNDPECLYLMRRFNRPSGIETADFFERCGIKPDF